MNDSDRAKSWYAQVAATYSPDQRKNWYSDVAEDYNKARPRYPQSLIDRAIEVAQLSLDATILELGCGPGIATVPFARSGFSMVCLEPSPAACEVARQNCAAYVNVTIVNTLFEEWHLEPERFNAVLAANAWHWTPPEIRCQKAAAALRENGSLILLWNMSPQLSLEVYQAVNEVYQAQAPSLILEREDSATQEQILQGLTQDVADSGLFKASVSEQLMCSITSSIDDYLRLLNTSSPYRMLDPSKRDSVFISLREVLERVSSEGIQVSYLSAFQVAQKI